MRLTKLDDFTLGLLTNDEVLAVDQDALGQQAVTVSNTDGGDLRVYAKPLADGTQAVGLFNLGPTTATVTAAWSDLGQSGAQEVRDLWRQRELGRYDGSFAMAVGPHGAELVRLRAAGTATFGLAVAPAAQTVAPGKATSFTLTLTPKAGFEAPVALSVEGLPEGVGAAIDPPSLSAAGTAVVWVSTNTGAAEGARTG